MYIHAKRRLPPSYFVWLSKCSNQVMTNAEQTVASELPEPKSEVVQHVFTTDIATLRCMMHSTPSETVPLVEGPDGFAIAKFSNLVHVTELANILLSPMQDLVKARAKAKAATKKAKAKASSLKARPAAAVPAPAAVAPADAAAAPAAAPAEPLRFSKEIVTVERSRSQVLARTGLRGPGQSKLFKYGRTKPYRTEAAAKQAGQAWLAQL